MGTNINSKDKKIVVLLPECNMRIGASIFPYALFNVLSNIVSKSELIILPLDEADRWYRLNNSRAKIKKDSKWFRVGRKFRYGMKVMEICLKEKPIVILCLHESMSSICLIVNFLLGINYVLLAQDIWKRKSRLLKISLRHSTMVLANSRHTVREAVDSFSVSPGRTHIIHPLIDENKFKPKKRREDLIKRYSLEGYKISLTIGRMNTHELEGKGYISIIRSMAVLNKKNIKVKCMFVGPGEGVEYLKHLTAGLNLLDNVIFVGGVSDDELCDYYNLCDVFVLPSKQEGFGMVYTEALACGKPVIGGNVRGALDALLDGRLGILVDPDDINSLAQAIIDVFEGNAEPHLIDPEYLRKEVIEHFGYDKFYGRVKGFLQEAQIW